MSGPTYFPMRGGLGLMGEAGPEAIMPLRRGADGRLVSQGSDVIAAVGRARERRRQHEKGGQEKAMHRVHGASMAYVSCSRMRLELNHERAMAGTLEDRPHRLA